MTAVVVPSGCLKISIFGPSYGVQIFGPTHPTTPVGRSSGSFGVVSAGAGVFVQVSRREPSVCGAAAVSLGAPGPSVSNHGDTAGALSPSPLVVTTAIRAIVPPRTVQRVLRTFDDWLTQSDGVPPSLYSMRTLFAAPASDQVTRIRPVAASAQLTWTSVGASGPAAQAVACAPVSRASVVAATTAPRRISARST